MSHLALGVLTSLLTTKLVRNHFRLDLFEQDQFMYSMLYLGAASHSLLFYDATFTVPIVDGFPIIVKLIYNFRFSRFK